VTKNADPSLAVPVSQLPRISILSPLCVWRGSVNIDKIQLILADETEYSIADNLNQALLTYSIQIFERGSFSRVAHTVERLTIQRMNYFGIDLETSKKTLQNLSISIEELVSQNISHDHIENLVQNNVKNLIQKFQLQNNSSSSFLPILIFSFIGIHLSISSFTYDQRNAIQIEEILIYDSHCNPICHLFADYEGYYHDNLSILSKVKQQPIHHNHQNNSEKKKLQSLKKQNLTSDTMAKKLESSSLASYCAISIISTNQDLNYGWGIGGDHVTILYYTSKEKENQQFSYLPKRTNEISLSLKNSDILLSSDGIPQIIQEIIPMFLVLYQKLTSINQMNSIFPEQISNSNSEEILTNSLTNYQFSLDCAHFVFAYEKNYLSEFSFTDMTLSSLVSSYRTWRFSLNLFEIHDLSPSGNYYPSILTKDSEISSPMVSAVFVESKEKNEISLTLNGFRFCILYRFILELMFFTTTHFLDGILINLTKLFDGIKNIDSQEFHLSDIGSLAPSDDDDDTDVTSDEEIDRMNEKHNNGRRKFHGGFFEYPECDNDLEGKEPTKTRGSLNIFGIEKLKLQRSRTTDVVTLDFPDQLDSSSDQFSKKLVCLIQLQQTTLYLPRNSNSDDLIGVTIQHLNFFQQKRQDSWAEPPSGFKLFDKNEMLYFDYYQNKWTKGSTLPSTVKASHTHQMNSSLTKGLGTQSQIPQRSSSPSPETEPDIEFFSASEGDGSDIDEFQDFQDTICEPTPSKQFRTTGPTHMKSHRAPLEDSGHGNPSTQIWRYIFEMSGVEFFSSMNGSYDPKGMKLNHIQTSHRRFQPIQVNKPVYSILSSNRINSWSKQCWKRISFSPSNILLLIEMTSTKMRILVTETEISSSLHLQLSMSDLYLLMSIYYDNMNENSEICTLSKNETTSNSNPVEQTEPPEYGTEQFCAYVRSIVSTTDILVVRSDIHLDCSMDNPSNGYFSHDIPALKYLFESNSNPIVFPDDIEEFPFATIRLQWVAILCQMNKDVLQVGIGASEGEVTDTRNLNHLFGHEFLKFFPRSISDFNGQRRRIFDHGFPDLDFGLKDSPQSIRTLGNNPFQITYYAVGSGWGLCNIGSDAPDFDFHNLDLVWLLSDFFALYFSYPEFGNPSLVPRKGFESALFQYFGIDTRIFITRPHIQTFKNPYLAVETLILAAEKGIYFRYVYDADNSVKIELDISDLSLVLMKQYRPPNLSRGLRGLAGSGKQIRTLFEYGSIQFTSHLDAKETTLDYLLLIGPEIHEKIDFETSTEEDEQSIQISNTTKSFIDFGKEFFSMTAVSIPPSKCVSPLYIPSRNFPKQSCRITTSYEDVLLSLELIMSCIGLANETKPKVSTPVLHI
jgi:hypothetical protein